MILGSCFFLKIKNKLSLIFLGDCLDMCRPEVIEIDSWVASAGKNGMRRDWVMRSYKTGEVLARATSTWCMMNGTTRRLAKIPDEVRSEIEPNFVDHRFAFSQDEPVAPRVAKLDDVSTEYRSSHLKSTPTDLDMNQHVNNLKYINWVLEVSHSKSCG
jgi:fatty acyl-ACP thioesterase B